MVRAIPPDLSQNRHQQRQPKLPVVISILADFSGSPWDCGHLAPLSAPAELHSSSLAPRQ
jgi:hypothetical protein